MIDSYTFAGCTNLQKVTLGAGVSSIAGSAFEYSGLKEIELSAKNKDLAVQGNVLYTEDMKKLVTYPVGSAATTFEIPDTVTNIGYGVFHGADNLTTVTTEDTDPDTPAGAYPAASRTSSRHPHGS